jgi:hypothetical protein
MQRAATTAAARPRHGDRGGRAGPNLGRRA